MSIDKIYTWLFSKRMKQSHPNLKSANGCTQHATSTNIPFWMKNLACNISWINFGIRPAYMSFIHNMRCNNAISAICYFSGI